MFYARNIEVHCQVEDPHTAYEFLSPTSQDFSEQEFPSRVPTTCRTSLVPIQCERVDADEEKRRFADVG